jgi:hypothetical protein
MALYEQNDWAEEMDNNPVILEMLSICSRQDIHKIISPYTTLDKLYVKYNGDVDCVLLDVYNLMRIFIGELPRRMKRYYKDYYRNLFIFLWNHIRRMPFYKLENYVLETPFLYQSIADLYLQHHTKESLKTLPPLTLHTLYKSSSERVWSEVTGEPNKACVFCGTREHTYTYRFLDYTTDDACFQSVCENDYEGKLLDF